MKKFVVLLAVLALGVSVAVAQDTAKVGLEKAAATKVDSVKAATTVKADSAKTAVTAKAAGVTKAKGMMDQKKTAAKKTVAKAEAWVTTKSGLKYRDIKVGTGDAVASGNTASVHYTGWLWEKDAKGKKFDSSRDRNQPFDVTNVGQAQVIAGWNEGLIGMKAGGIRELLVPPTLGYGERGTPGGPIPPNATLLFEIEVLKVTK